MRNYTTKTAALKATTIDTRILDTKVLKINGEVFDPSNIGGGVKQLTVKWSDGFLHDDGAWSFELYINEDYYLGSQWMPHKIYINYKEVMCEFYEYAGGWMFCVVQPGDNLSEIYGGITNDTPVTIYYSLR